MHKIAVHIFLLADILFNSRLYQLASVPIAQPMLLGTAAALMLTYFVVCCVRRLWKPAVLFLLLVMILTHQMQLFSLRWLIDLQVNSAFQYIWLLSFVVFYYIYRVGLLEYTLETVFKYATAYSLLYFVLCAGLFIRVFPHALVSSLTLTDPERGARIFIDAPAAALAWFGWMLKARSEPTRFSTLMCALCITAIFLSLSRVYILIVVLASVLLWLNLRYRTIALIFGVIFMFAAGSNLYGLLDDQYNPYSLYANDSSGNYRIHEYELARYFIFKDPIFGFGIAPSSKLAGLVLTNDFFSASDIGPTGIMFDWGAAGLLLFLIGTYISLSFPLSFVSHKREHVAMFLTGCVMALYGCVAPIIVTGGATYFGFVLACWMLMRQRLSP